MSDATYDTFLRFKIMKRWADGGFPVGEKYSDRIDLELSIIEKMQYSSYFLIVSELCDFMRSRGIMFIVRGSGCGSCVVWGLGISHIWLDPVKYKLPFERFLNPSRVSLPDLDIDIDDTRRDEVVQHTIDMYGRERVAKIITFGTLGAKAAITDIARALQIPDHQKLSAEISAFIPAGKGADGKNHRLADLLKVNEGLRDYQAKHPELFEYAMRVEGKVRNASIHAAGTIISPEAMTKYLPTIFWGNPEERTPDENFPTTQWDMYDAEERGLLKMDYLGLKTLRVVDRTVKAINVINKMYGRQDVFNIDRVDRHDPLTWDMLGDGRTVSVFQVERAFVQNFARRMDLGKHKDPWQMAVLISIIRPGMMDTGATEQYLKRAGGQEEAKPLDPLLEKTLAENFGLFVFQEDCMWAAVEMAGMSMAEADDLRRAISKKKPKDMARIKPVFVQGCIEKKGATKERAEFVWQQMETFGRYGFNNSHAAAYGMVIGWFTAYLKCRHALPYMMNVINSESGTTSKEDGYNYKVAEYVEEARALGIKISPPCVKRSQAVCSIVLQTNEIRFGLTLIKKVSMGAVEWIFSTQMNRANSFKDFVMLGYEIRLNPQQINAPYSKVSKTDYESLIMSGAMDCYEGADRAKMLAMLPKVMEMTKKFHEQTGKKAAGKRVNLTPEQVLEQLQGYSPSEGEYPELSLEARLEMEQEVTGCFLSVSPFEPYRKVLNDFTNCTIGDIREGVCSWDKMVFAGVLTKKTTTVIKNGKNKGAEMAFLGFTGIDGGTMEVTCFNKTWLIVKEKHRNGEEDMLEKGKVFCVSVKRDKDRADSYVLNDLQRLSNLGFDQR